MGLEVFVERVDAALGPVLARLAEEGLTATVVMVDGALVLPGTMPPDGWREVRVKTPAGTLSLARRPGGIAVVVFGNADEGLQAAQARIAAALRGGV